MIILVAAEVSKSSGCYFEKFGQLLRKVPSAGTKSSQCWNKKFPVLERFYLTPPLGLITTTIPIKFPRATPSIKPVARCQP